MAIHRTLAIVSICAILCCLMSVGVSASVDRQPLKNGDFDTGNLSKWKASATVSVTKSAAYAGGYGALLTGDGDWDDLLSQTFTVLPGYSYTLSFWYKAEAVGVSWYLLDEDESGMRLCRGWAGNAAWTQVTKEFEATADTVCLLFRGSGSHLAERVYLDSVRVTINPCDVHTYDNACDTDCNICGQTRTVGDHLYDHDCDIFCNHCGFEREPSGKHTYDYPCATLCNYCGAPRVGDVEHTYSDVCDVTCDFCDEIREVPHFYDFACDPSCSHCGAIRTDIPEEAHTYDDIYDAECNLCDHVRVPAPKPMERLAYGGYAISEDVHGVAFRFRLACEGAKLRPDNSYVSKSALVYRYNNGVGYKLIRVGAVMSNEKNPVLDLEHLTTRTINIKAGYLCDATDNYIVFAVRIVNIPEQGYNTTIYARPYYVYSDGKEEFVVYGETFTGTYNEIAGLL